MAAYTGDVLIAGAGIGGLTAALALLRAGHNVQVLEQASQMLEIGAGVQLSPNCTRVLFELGVGDQLVARASEPVRKEIRLWNSGRHWKLFDLGPRCREKYGFPYLTVHRAHLHAILLEAVRQLAPQAIVLGAKVSGCQSGEDAATLNTEDGRSFTAMVAIGADGVHSAVRAAMFGDDRPVYSGLMAWRGLIPMASLPLHLRQATGVNWVGPGSHVIHYPLSEDGLVNFVGAVERDDWKVESWNERGSVEECLNDFQGWHDDVQSLIRSIATPYKWALMTREPMACWTRGRLTLLGDACHPTLPFLAQGAAMAIEDGYLLARALKEYAGRPEEALARYENVRKDRTSRVVRGSNENARRFHDRSLASETGAGEYVDREWTEARVVERYDWLFRYDATRVGI